MQELTVGKRKLLVKRITDELEALGVSSPMALAATVQQLEHEVYHASTTMAQYFSSMGSRTSHLRSELLTQDAQPVVGEWEPKVEETGGGELGVGAGPGRGAAAYDGDMNTDAHHYQEQMQHQQPQQQPDTAGRSARRARGAARAAGQQGEGADESGEGRATKAPTPRDRGGGGAAAVQAAPDAVAAGYGQHGQQQQQQRRPTGRATAATAGRPAPPCALADVDSPPRRQHLLRHVDPNTSTTTSGEGSTTAPAGRARPAWAHESTSAPMAGGQARDAEDEGAGREGPQQAANAQRSRPKAANAGTQTHEDELMASAWQARPSSEQACMAAATGPPAPRQQQQHPIMPSQGQQTGWVSNHAQSQTQSHVQTQAMAQGAGPSWPGGQGSAGGGPTGAQTAMRMGPNSSAAGGQAASWQQFAPVQQQHPQFQQLQQSQQQQYYMQPPPQEQDQQYQHRKAQLPRTGGSRNALGPGVDMSAWGGAEPAVATTVTRLANSHGLTPGPFGASLGPSEAVCDAGAAHSAPVTRFLNATGEAVLRSGAGAGPVASSAGSGPAALPSGAAAGRVATTASSRGWAVGDADRDWRAAGGLLTGIGGGERPSGRLQGGYGSVGPVIPGGSTLGQKRGFGGGVEMEGDGGWHLSGVGVLAPGSVSASQQMDAHQLQQSQQQQQWWGGVQAGAGGAQLVQQQQQQQQYQLHSPQYQQLQSAHAPPLIQRTTSSPAEGWQLQSLVQPQDVSNGPLGGAASMPLTGGYQQQFVDSGDLQGQQQQQQQEQKVRDLLYARHSHPLLHGERQQHSSLPGQQQQQHGAYGGRFDSAAGEPAELRSHSPVQAPHHLLMYHAGPGSGSGGSQFPSDANLQTMVAAAAEGGGGVDMRALGGHGMQVAREEQGNGDADMLDVMYAKFLEGGTDVGDPGPGGTGPQGASGGGAGEGSGGSGGEARGGEGRLVPVPPSGPRTFGRPPSLRQRDRPNLSLMLPLDENTEMGPQAMDEDDAGGRPAAAVAGVGSDGGMGEQQDQQGRGTGPGGAAAGGGDNAPLIPPEKLRGGADPMSMLHEVLPDLISPAEDVPVPRGVRGRVFERLPSFTPHPEDVVDDVALPPAGMPDIPASLDPPKPAPRQEPQEPAPPVPDFPLLKQADERECGPVTLQPRLSDAGGRGPERPAAFTLEEVVAGQVHATAQALGRSNTFSHNSAQPAARAVMRNFTLPPRLQVPPEHDASHPPSHGRSPLPLPLPESGSPLLAPHRSPAISPQQLQLQHAQQMLLQHVHEQQHQHQQHQDLSHQLPPRRPTGDGSGGPTRPPLPVPAPAPSAFLSSAAGNVLLAGGFSPSAHPQLLSATGEGGPGSDGTSNLRSSWAAGEGAGRAGMLATFGSTGLGTAGGQLSAGPLGSRPAAQNAAQATTGAALRNSWSAGDQGLMAALQASSGGGGMGGAAGSSPFLLAGSGFAAPAPSPAHSPLTGEMGLVGHSRHLSVSKLEQQLQAHHQQQHPLSTQGSAGFAVPSPPQQQLSPQGSGGYLPTGLSPQGSSGYMPTFMQQQHQQLHQLQLPNQLSPQMSPQLSPQSSAVFLPPPQMQQQLQVQQQQHGQSQQQLQAAGRMMRPPPLNLGSHDGHGSLSGTPSPSPYGSSAAPSPFGAAALNLITGAGGAGLQGLSLQQQQQHLPQHMQSYQPQQQQGYCGTGTLASGGSAVLDELLHGLMTGDGVARGQGGGSVPGSQAGTPSGLVTGQNTQQGYLAPGSTSVSHTGAVWGEASYTQINQAGQQIRSFLSEGMGRKVSDGAVAPAMLQGQGQQHVFMQQQQQQQEQQRQHGQQHYYHLQQQQQQLQMQQQVAYHSVQDTEMSEM